MNCDQTKSLIQAYVDGELDAARILEVETHLRGCPACTAVWRNQLSLKKALKSDALYFAAPPELHRRIKDELRALAGNDSRPKFWHWNWKWLTAASTSVAAVCLALLMTSTFTRPSAQSQLAQELVSSHVRSLMASHALDVVSSDQHTVKPWFNGKLDFSPPVKDLAAQEFPLLGGRLDYLDGHTMAALVFQRHKHVINLFIWPAKETESLPGTVAPLHGYNLVHWSRTGMTFWAVSDLNNQELVEFAKIFAAN